MIIIIMKTKMRTKATMMTLKKSSFLVHNSASERTLKRTRKYVMAKLTLEGLSVVKQNVVRRDNKIDDVFPSFPNSICSKKLSFVQNGNHRYLSDNIKSYEKLEALLKSPYSIIWSYTVASFISTVVRFVAPFFFEHLRSIERCRAMFIIIFPKI